jgi:HK97 family phage portal protein
MSLLTYIFQKQITQLVNETLKSQGSEFYSKMLENVKNQPVYMPDDLESYVKTAFLFNPIVYSIITFITQKAGTIPWAVYEVKNEKALNLYKSASHNLPYWKKEAVKVKALESLPNHDLNQLFITPNPLQSWSELTEQEIGFKLITGNSYTHCIGPEGGANAGRIQEMWNLPSQLVVIVTGDQITPVLRYEMRGYSDVKIPPEQIIHVKNWTPSYVNGQFLYGVSPIQAARRVITRSNSSYDASVASFQNMGAYGMITGDAKSDEQSLTPEQLEEIKRQYKKKTGPKNAGQSLITSAGLKWQQMGMSPVDMNVIESDKMDLRTLCMIFHVPSELFGDAATKTYSNTKEAGSAVYTNAVIPALTQKRDAINKMVKSRYKENIYVDFDVSMISELQDDITILTTALANAWYLTPNEKRDMLSFGMDESNDVMNDYFIPAGLTPLSAYTEPAVTDAAIEEAAKQLNLTDYVSK